MDISRVGGVGGVAQTGMKQQTRQNLPGSSGLVDASMPVSGKKQFMDYMRQTPAERMQYTWLAQRGISKEQFDAMSPEEKQKLLNQMRQEIEQKVQRSVENKATDILV